MADNTNDFDAMIAKIEGQIAALQRAVGALRDAKDAMSGIVSGVGHTGRSGNIAVDEFTGKSITDATEVFLKLVGRPPRSTQEIVEGLQKGGLERVSQDSVATLLIRSHNSGGKVVRVQKGLWGLEEWYGKRPPKITRMKNGDDETEPTEETKAEERATDSTD